MRGAVSELVIHLRVRWWRLDLVVLLLLFSPDRYRERLLDLLLPWCVSFKGVTCGEGKVEARSIALSP